MATVAPGVSELRLRGEDGAYRVFYYSASAKGVLVLHAFVKQTRQTSAHEIHLARKHLKELRDAQD
jgi:phage-related protein